MCMFVCEATESDVVPGAEWGVADFALSVSFFGVSMHVSVG